ncbi:MAG: hypothetical protein ACTSRH_05735 [Promethearchaeota archaeon]
MITLILLIGSFVLLVISFILIITDLMFYKKDEKRRAEGKLPKFSSYGFLLTLLALLFLAFVSLSYLPF